MKRELASLLAALVTAAAGSAAAAPGFGSVGGIDYEQVRFYSPSQAAWPTSNGHVESDLCRGADRCGEPMTFDSVYGGTITATARDRYSFSDGIVIQDLSPKHGGLGVISRLNHTSRLFGDDGINAGDALQLAFSRPVTLVGMHFFDTDHSRTDRGDFGTLSIDGGASHVFALQSYVSADPAQWITGTHFNFGYGADNDAPYGYYLGAVKLMAQPVPEPETYALMLAGLGAIAMVARRRKQRG